MSHAYDVDSDDESCGEKIEISAKDLQDFDKAIFQFAISEDFENDKVHNITVTCVHQGQELGSVFARLIDLEDSEERDISHQDMDEISHDCMDLGTIISDEVGMVQRKWLRDPASKGSGIWTASLGLDDFLVVEKVQVAMAYRHKGVGKAMLEELLKLANERNSSHGFFCATQLNTAPDISFDQLDFDALFSANKARAAAYCRAVGFCWDYTL